MYNVLNIYLVASSNDFRSLSILSLVLGLIYIKSYVYFQCRFNYHFKPTEHSLFVHCLKSFKNITNVVYRWLMDNQCCRSNTVVQQTSIMSHVRNDSKERTTGGQKQVKMVTNEILIQNYANAFLVVSVHSKPTLLRMWPSSGNYVAAIIFL